MCVASSRRQQCQCCSCCSKQPCHGSIARHCRWSAATTEHSSHFSSLHGATDDLRGAGHHGDCCQLYRRWVNLCIGCWICVMNGGDKVKSIFAWDRQKIYQFLRIISPHPSLRLTRQHMICSAMQQNQRQMAGYLMNKLLFNNINYALPNFNQRPYVIP